MTFLRKKALEISSWVTWLAAPGCKEWAEGLEREVAFIESDWRALGWALGSTRVLLEPQSASANGKRRKPRFIDWSGWSFYAMFALDYVLEAVFAKSWQVRVGSSIIAFGWAYFGTRSVMAWLREGDEPTDLAARELHARGLLVEKLARARTMRRWIPMVVINAMFGGFLLLT